MRHWTLAIAPCGPGGTKWAAWRALWTGYLRLLRGHRAPRRSFRDHLPRLLPTRERAASSRPSSPEREGPVLVGLVATSFYHAHNLGARSTSCYLRILYVDPAAPAGPGAGRRADRRPSYSPPADANGHTSCCTG